MNQLTKVFEEQDLTIVEVDGEPKFLLKDVCNILELGQVAGVKRRLSKDVISNHPLKTAGGKQVATFVNEDGLYDVILDSRKKEAKKFRKWITSEVVPSIRKHGAYMTQETIEQALLNPDTLIQLATNLKEERTQRMIAEQRVNELQPKADYYDTFINNKGLVTITSIAKNYGMTARKMNKLLHDLGIQFKQSSAWFLYSKYQSEGYTHTEPHPYVDSEGRDQVRPNTKWTPKGHAFIYYLLKKEGILPLIERKEAI